MTPDERVLLTGFLQDLAQARSGAKDPEAASLISQAMNGNPDAPYLLVQHTIVADQALHAAQARIADLEAQLRRAQAPAQPTSFLGAGGSPWGAPSGPTGVPQTSAPYGPPAAPGPFSPGGGLGSFLRTAGTTAAGVAGGEMLFHGLSGLFGGGGGMFGAGGGMFGGSYAPLSGSAFAQPAENVTINNYGGQSGDEGSTYPDQGDQDGSSWADDDQPGDSGDVSA